VQVPGLLASAGRPVARRCPGARPAWVARSTSLWCIGSWASPGSHHGRLHRGVHAHPSDAARAHSRGGVRACFPRPRLRR